MMTAMLCAKNIVADEKLFDLWEVTRTPNTTKRQSGRTSGSDGVAVGADEGEAGGWGGVVNDKPGKCIMQCTVFFFQVLYDRGDVPCRGNLLDLVGFGRARLPIVWTREHVVQSNTV